jgi:hypothetical protein
MLGQTVHRRPITAGAVAVPRAAAGQRMLYVEADLGNPNPVLGLAPEDREQYLANDRAMLTRYGIRFVVSASDERPAIADALGLRLADSDGTVAIYERTD